ncbi:hypothetical protein [Scandinavium sp.]|uniref:hypothetical protein n=1 Tax=Scandinavium sp. TaxID=2830653 RepID=UPI00289EE11E|nr:hypothetical protein [Scandinavium sp.]
MDVPTFDEASNAWLLTLPESRTGGRYQPVCRVVVIRTLKEIYSPASGSLDVKRKLAGRTCTLSLYWNGGGWHQEPEYKAEFKVNIWDGTTELDLTNSDFMLDYNLRGRGLGSWIMNQLISWAKTLPTDTPVKPIRTSPVDEDDKENMFRRDRFWNGIGFRFKPGGRLSLPLSVGELQYPKGLHCPLSAVPLHKGVDELHRLCESQKLEIDRLKSGQSYQAKQIRYLTERQWDVLLIKSLSFIIFSPIFIPCWLYTKLKQSRETTHEK